jgi:hypothetical protein
MVLEYTKLVAIRGTDPYLEITQIMYQNQHKIDEQECYSQIMQANATQ